MKIMGFLVRYSIIKCRKNIKIRTKTLHSGEKPCINSNDTVSLVLQTICTAFSRQYWYACKTSQDSPWFPSDLGLGVGKTRKECHG